jgi:hypothetical protein
VTPPAGLPDPNPANNTSSVSLQVVPNPNQVHYFAVGAGFGGVPIVQVYSSQTGALVYNLLALDPNFFHGGVRVATGDINGDGVDDIICAAGPGSFPVVRIFDGATGQQMAGPLGVFLAFPIGFAGGLNVAAGDVNGDGFGDVIVGADAGSVAAVVAFSGADGSQLLGYTAFPNFLGGVRVAAGDVTGSGVADIITAPGAGGLPIVEIWSDQNGSPAMVNAYFAFPPSFLGGLTVAAGDINGDGVADVVVGTGTGGASLVVGYSGASTQLLTAFLAFPPGSIPSLTLGDLGPYPSSVSVAVTALGGGTQDNIIVGAGPGERSVVSIFQPLSGIAVDTFFAFDPIFRGGVFVGGS